MDKASKKSDDPTAASVASKKSEDPPAPSVAKKPSPASVTNKKKPVTATAANKKKTAPSAANLRLAGNKKKAVPTSASLRPDVKKKKAPNAKNNVPSVPEAVEKKKRKLPVKKNNEEHPWSPTNSMTLRSRGTNKIKEKAVVTKRTLVARKTKKSAKAKLETSDSEATGGGSTE